MQKKWKALLALGALLVVLLLLGIAALFQQAKGGVPVLNYHQINDTEHNSLTVNTKQFEAQMKYLAEEGYTTITPAEMIDAWEGKGTLPEKPVIITFDDGYLDNYNHAYPILEKYPQAIAFGGHLHFPLNDPRSIWQASFTSFGCGSTRYMAIENGKYEGMTIAEVYEKDPKYLKYCEENIDEFYVSPSVMRELKSMSRSINDSDLLDVNFDKMSDDEIDSFISGHDEEEAFDEERLERDFDWESNDFADDSPFDEFEDEFDEDEFSDEFGDSFDESLDGNLDDLY